MPTRLLCVDDDPLITQSLQPVLKTALKHWDVQLVNDPYQGLDLINDDWQPDVVVSDMMMPGMSGLNFLTHVKDRCPKASLLMLTGYADKQSAITAINDLGLFYYLEKPWNVDTLPVILRKAAEHTELKYNLIQAQYALDQAATINRLRDDFVATLTHDLKTPLQASEQTLGVLLGQTIGPLTDKQQQVMQMLLTNQKDLLKLVNTLLLVYRFESGQHPLACQVFSLAQWIPGVLQALQPLAASRQQQLQLHRAEGPLLVNADAFALQRVIGNLVGNAIRYTQPGGCIHVTITTLADQVLLQVKDNGRGIPAEDMPHLFQRFSQGSSRVRHSGSGLGLYLCRQIAEAHGGSITVTSKEDEGNEFTVALPGYTQPCQPASVDVPLANVSVATT
jgi:signal transduction histidine kinase